MVEKPDQNEQKKDNFEKLSDTEFELLRWQIALEIQNLMKARNQEDEYHRLHYVEGPLQNGYVSRNRGDKEYWRDDQYNDDWVRENMILPELVQEKEGRKGTGLSYPNTKPGEIEQREWKLGEILTSGYAVCRHLQLACMVLGEAVGLQINMVRGGAKITMNNDENVGPDGHSWCEMVLKKDITIFQKGTKFILDPNYDPKNTKEIVYYRANGEGLQRVIPVQEPLPMVKYIW